MLVTGFLSAGNLSPPPLQRDADMTPKRKAISKKTRFEVFKRDSFTCQYCGCHPPSVVLHIDHIIPVKEGGNNHQDNLITACQPCNLGKAANSLTNIPRSLADKAKDTKEREEQIKGYSEIMLLMYARIEDETFMVMERLYPKETSYNRQDFRSVSSFIEKIGIAECLDAAEITLANAGRYRDAGRFFKYFCGVCWNKVRRQENG